MKNFAFAVSVLAACAASAPALAQTDPAIGSEVYAIKVTEEQELIGTIVRADANAFRIKIGEQCIGLARDSFTESGDQFNSPWPKDTLQGSIAGGNPEDSVCLEGPAGSDPAIGKQVVGKKAVQTQEVVGTIRHATAEAFSIQIGDRCIGLERASFTEKEGRFESPWPKDTIVASMDSGDPANFVCAA